MRGLFGDTGKQSAFFFSLDHTHGFPIHEQEIIAGAGFERGFPQRYSATGGKVHGLEILHDPAAPRELRVDLLTGFFFRGHVP